MPPSPGLPAATEALIEQATRPRQSSISQSSGSGKSTCLPPATWAKLSPGWGVGPLCAPLPAGRDCCSTQASDGQERCALLGHAGRQLPAQACSIPTVVEEKVGAVLIPTEDVRSTVTQDGANSHTTAPWGQQPLVRLSPALRAACLCITSSAPKTPSSPSLLLHSLSSGAN